MMQVDTTAIARQFSGVEFFFLFAPKQGACRAAPEDGIAVLQSQGCVAITSVPPLAHVDGNDLVLLRGYDVGAGVHSYSGAARIAALKDPENGVFSFARAGAQTEVRSDPFGVSPLYWRELEEGWLFGSHPVLLLQAGDGIDENAWLNIMQMGAVLGDATAFKGIHRFPAGSRLTIKDGKANLVQWFDFASLPQCEQPIDDEAAVEVEAAFQTSLDACLRMADRPIVLPFSSGFDSRRLFAALCEKKHPFEAAIARTLHDLGTDEYDIDSVCAPPMADAFGVPWHRIPDPSLADITEDTRRRAFLVGSETLMHDWSLPMMRWLQKREPCMLFDGLAGDSFANYCFTFDGLHVSPEQDARIIVGKLTNPATLATLAARFPRQAQYAAGLNREIERLPATLARSEWFFIHARTRRSTSAWLGMMQPPGHVTFYPYFDLRFMRATMVYDAAQKRARPFQAECLKRFYPEYFKFPGTRAHPPGLKPEPTRETQARNDARDLALFGDFSLVREAMQYLGWKGRAFLLAAHLIKPLRRQRAWLFVPLLQMTLMRRTHQPLMRRV